MALYRCDSDLGAAVRLERSSSWVDSCGSYLTITYELYRCHTYFTFAVSQITKYPHGARILNASTFLLIFYDRPRWRSYSCGYNLHEWTVNFGFVWVPFVTPFLSPNHPLLITFMILINHCIKKINWSYAHRKSQRTPHMLPIFEESSLQRMRSYTNETLYRSWHTVSL